MEKFKDNETVVFLGDSITFNSRWISEIFEYYANNCRDKKVKIYSCGVPGGRAETGMFDLERNILKFSPDRVIVMYGMNEINASVYLDDMEESADTIETRRWHLFKFYNDLTSIANRLIGRNIKVGFCTNTPKDTTDVTEKCDFKTVNIGLKNAADITKRVAMEHNCEFVDFFTPMLEFVDTVRKINKDTAFIKEDRTHPNDLGNSIMAKLFLNAQGFKNVPMPTAENIADKSIYTPETERMQIRREAEENVQYFYAAEWLILRNYRDFSIEEKKSKVKEFLKNSEEGYFKSVAEKYLNIADSLEKNRKKLIEVTEDIYK